MVSRLARYPSSSCKLVQSKICIRHVIKWPHACDNGVMTLYSKWPHEEVIYSKLCKSRAQNATVCKFHSCSTVEVGKMYYSVMWLWKIMSISQVIVLEAD